MWKQASGLILGGTVLLAACSGGGSATVETTSNTGTSSSTSVSTQGKNVIFFLGDGMGMTTMTAARIYSVGEAGELTMDTLPETAFVKTYSNNAQVTDSAPSMSAYMTGVKMNNEVISMTPDTSAYNTTTLTDYLSGADSTCPTSGNGSAVSTLLELAKSAGRAVGVVTTTRITHATPAATYSHICHRDGENTIANQMVPTGAGFNAALGDGIDVVLGGGLRHFNPKTTTGSKRSDSRDLVAEMKTQGYSFAANTSELLAFNASGSGKLLGLFNNDHMSYDLDRDPVKEPSLAEMTGKAIDVLANRKKDKGFFLMVEGGRIDHALHSTNARRALQDTVAFDKAIKAAIDKMQVIDPGLKNTLIVVTADHDHTLVLNGYAQRTGASSDSNPGVLGLVKNYVTGSLTLDVNSMPYSIIGFGTGENRLGTRTALTEAQTYDKDYHHEATIPSAAGSETHGGADVFLGALGMGSDKFTGVLDNTEIFGLVRAIVGL